MKRLIKSESGSGSSLVLLSLAVVLVLIFSAVNIIDYAVYSNKTSIFSRSIAYAVSAAAQEIDYTSAGLNLELDDAGQGSVVNVSLNQGKAIDVFFSTFGANTGVTRDALESHTLIMIVSPTSTGLDYTIVKKGSAGVNGTINEPTQIQGILNSSIASQFAETYSGQKEAVINVNGNVGANSFSKRTYFIVFIKDWQINGVVNKRAASFLSFTGAKVERYAPH